MRYALLFLSFFTISVGSFAQHKTWGIGFRLGDPMGVSVKKYLANQRAFELNLGRTGVWGYNYKNSFYRHQKFNDYDYGWHKVRSAISLQGHYLFQRGVKGKDFKGLDWYYGFGGQLRTFTVDYQYKYYYGPGKHDWTTRWEKVNDIDLGIDGMIGLEYSWREVPLTVFVDMNLFVEIADNPFHLFLQGGTGIRYYF